MKKLLLLAAFFTFTSLAAMAQSGSFGKGDNLFSVGIGIGTPFFGSGYSSSLPINPTVSYEKGITDAISVGGTLSYASSKFDDVKFTATYIGGKGAYHFNELLQVDKKYDVYAGVSLGYVIVSDNYSGYGATASAFGSGVFAGGRYYFSPKAAVYGEVGYQSLSFLNIGVTFKF